MKKMLLGIDVGTTNIKFVLCDIYGKVRKTISYSTPQKRERDILLIDADKIRELLFSALNEFEKKYTLDAIGITSMAEAGILVDKSHKKAITDILPWADKRVIPFFEAINNREFDKNRFKKTGLHNSYKYSLYKLLMLRDTAEIVLEGKFWLSVASYVSFLLTETFYEHQTLAARTYAYDIENNCFNTTFLNKVGIPESIFPPVLMNGEKSGFYKGTEVYICGHDHFCAAYAATQNNNSIFMSLGTTAVILGSMDSRPLKAKDYESGFSYGKSLIPGQLTWLGSIQYAGGAIEWYKREFGKKGFKFMDKLLLEKTAPGSLLFFPYLCGSGAPYLDINIKGALIGLDQTTNSADIFRAILEGIAYELRLIIESAGEDNKKQTIIAAGGGSVNKYLMQIISNVLGCSVSGLQYAQAAATGAALFTQYAKPTTAKKQPPVTVYTPQKAYTEMYNELYLNRYKPFLSALRKLYASVKEVDNG